MVLSVSKATQKRLARAVKNSERTRGGVHPLVAQALKSPGMEILVILSEDLETDSSAKAKLRYFNLQAATWATDPKEFDVYAWKQSGTLAEGKEGWCISYGGRLWMRIPEECPG